jgi:hypothetical protein
MNQCESTPGQRNMQNQVKLNKGSLCSVSRMYFGAYLHVLGFGTKLIWEEQSLYHILDIIIDMSVSGSGRSRCSLRVQVGAYDFTMTTSETLPSKIKFSAVNLNAWCSMYSLELAGRHVRRRLYVECFQLLESTSEALRCHTTVGHTVVSRHEIQAECISTWCCIMLAIS